MLSKDNSQANAIPLSGTEKTGTVPQWGSTIIKEEIDRFSPVRDFDLRMEGNGPETQCQTLASMPRPLPSLSARIIAPTGRE